jgi:hypothetical protein
MLVNDDAFNLNTVVYRYVSFPAVTDSGWMFLIMQTGIVQTPLTHCWSIPSLLYTCSFDWLMFITNPLSSGTCLKKGGKTFPFCINHNQKKESRYFCHLETSALRQRVWMRMRMMKLGWMAMTAILIKGATMHNKRNITWLHVSCVLTFVKGVICVSGFETPWVLNYKMHDQHFRLSFSFFLSSFSLNIHWRHCHSTRTMKFSHSLKFNAVPDWLDHYVA